MWLKQWILQVGQRWREIPGVPDSQFPQLLFGYAYIYMNNQNVGHDLGPTGWHSHDFPDNFEKISKRQNKHKNLPSMQGVNRIEEWNREDIIHRGSYMSAHVLLNVPVLNDLGKRVKCEACRKWYFFFATSLINSIILKHESKILFIMWR